MAINVPIKNVLQPQHLDFFASTSLGAATSVKIEVFTGIIACNFTGDDGTVHRTNVVSFVPIGPNEIRPYNDGDILDTTIICTTSSVADDDDEANVAAVDRASVKLEPQVFGGISGSPLCLILRATVAALSATVHAITYQVTVKSRGRETLNPITLDPDVSPD